MSRTLLAIVTFILTTACAASPPAKTILILGDSLSAGFGIARQQSWPVLLEQRLHTQAYPYRVANVSISGETTRGGLSRLAPALEQHRPAIIIVALGANDGLRGLPLEQLRDNLNAIIQLSKASRARILLLGMQLPPNYGIDYTRKFQQIYAELARRHKVPLEPFLLAGLADNRDAFQSDGLHPTAQAQPVILDNVWRGLRPLLRKH